MQKFSRAALVSVTLIALAAVAGSPARAGFFVNALSSSPLGSNVFGDYDHSHVVTADAATFFTNGTDFYTAEGFANANLRTGSLHASVSANYGYDATDPSTGNALGAPFPIGNANFGDTLTFLGSFTGQTVTIHATVTGQWSNITGSPWLGGTDFQLMLLPAGTIDANAANEFAVFNATNALVNIVDDVGPTQTFPLQVDATTTLNGVNPSIDFAADLNLLGLAGNIGEAFSGDFTHSADFSITAPPGVVIESDSGTFPGTVAPEPGTMCLALTGIAAGLGIARRRKGVACAGAQQ